MPTHLPGRRALAWLAHVPSRPAPPGTGSASRRSAASWSCCSSSRSCTSISSTCCSSSSTFSGVTQTKAFQTWLGGPKRDRNVSLRVALTLGRLARLRSTSAAPHPCSTPPPSRRSPCRCAGPAREVYRPALFWTCLWTAIGPAGHRAGVDHALLEQLHLHAAAGARPPGNPDDAGHRAADVRVQARPGARRGRTEAQRGTAPHARPERRRRRGGHRLGRRLHLHQPGGPSR